MTSSTDDSGDISAEFAPDIHTSCPTQASRSATGKKNLTWLGANVLHLVMILYNNDSYQCTLLPSQELAESDPALKLHKHPIFWDISKMIFPGTSVDPNHIKSKLRWLLETYYREKKKLSPTGAGTLLEDMDASNLYAWFERMHKMMNGQFNADPAALITTPSLNFTSNDEPDMPLNGSADIPMDICGSELYNHSTHSHGLPPILNLIKPTNPLAAVASTSGASFAGTGDDDIFNTPSPPPLQAQPPSSTAGSLDVSDSTSSQSSAQLSPSTKHKQGALDHKCDTLAEAFYHSSIDTLQIHLQLEQECTRHEKILEAEHTKHKEMHLHCEREEKEHDEHASVEQDAHQNTSNNNNMDSSFNLPVL
ncbi:uncharacterized protein UHO2_05680 [Ustilago hordei]|uniref:uncharacterized protein n=1 Tax=Ustilago hordei TaxID=120017 RepID=UPI001A5BFDF4|nr:uncharacterized protein UHO2_05680 [Ustilago hordei]SYW76963.1 uncharacterized protein UHO2_05680 [Ustilago hordei]